MLNLLSFTLWLKYLAIFCWYFFILWEAWSLLRPDNLGSALIVCHCFACQKIPSWGWWVLLRPGRQLLCRKLGWKASLLSGFVPLSYKPIECLLTPWVMLPLPLLIGPWWSWARSGLLLPSIHWLEDVLGMSIGSWCPGLTKWSESVAVELSSIVWDDHHWDPKPAHNIFPYKILYLCFSDRRQRFYLDPFSEVVNCDEEELHLSLSLW